MIFRDLVVFAQKSRAERDRDIALAWHTAALTRGTKGLPKLERLLSESHHGSSGGPKPQSIDEQRMNLQKIFGGPAQAPRG